MKTNSILHIFKLTIFVICFPFSTNAQGNYFHDSDTLKLSGIVINQNKFSKRFAILMRDTTLNGNRFDYRWHKGLDTNGRVTKINYQLPAFLIGITLASSCDSMLLFDSNSNQIKWTSYPKKRYSTLTKKYIRLYIGYIDDKGEKNIVVQLISLKEFKIRQQIYSEELFLVVPRKELHFAIINIGH